MTSQEVSIIKNEILDQLELQSRLIDDLTPTTTLTDSDLFEINKGRNVSFKTLREYFNADNALNTESLALYLQTNKYATQDWVSQQNYAKLSDIPSLAGYATETFVNEALKGKLDKSTFDKLFRVIYNADGSIKHIETDYTFVSLGDLQSLSAEDPIEGGSGGSVVGLLTDWAEYNSATAKDLALSAELGHGLLSRIQGLEGAGFLTAADISHLATNSALTAHINDTAVHITAEERAKWNKTATDLSAILGADSDTIINKWEEVIAFLDTYTEADTLANLLSNKADKATTLAGYGITDAYTKTALDTLLDGKVSKSGDTMTGALNFGSANARIANSYNYLMLYGGDGMAKVVVGTNEVRRSEQTATVNLGTSEYRWSNVYANTINVTSTALVSNLNADLLDGLHASDLFATKTLFSKADYQHYVVLLWKTNETTTHRISGKLYTETAGSLRYQAADIDMWFSRWNSTSYDANLRLVTYGLGTAWKLVTCTYNGEEWYALQHTNIQATAACFVGVSARINFTAVKYYTSNTATVDNAEIYNSIVDRSNLLKRSYVGDNAIAYITDTVAAADKLQTARTLWGQSFDGTGNVSGGMTGVGSITPASANTADIGSTSLPFRYGVFKWLGSTTGENFNVGANYQNQMTFLVNGNVGIGTTSPAYKLDVAGTARTTVLKIGSITLKDVNGHLEIDKTIVSLGDVQSLSDADVVEGGGTIADMLKEWSAYNNSMADTHALSAGLGVELHNRLSGVENSYVSKTVADNTYQPKGNYLTSSDISNLAINTETFWTYVTGGYTAVRFRNAALAQAAHDNYLEFWQSDIGFFNIKAGKFITSGGTSAQFLMADGSVSELNALDDRYVTRTTAQTVTAKKIFSGSIGLNTISDNWNVARMNNTLSWLYSRETTVANSPGTWYSGVSFMTEYVGFQLAVHGGGGEELKFRKISDANTWTAWRDILHSGNYNSYALPLTGGTLTGALTFQCGSDTKLIFNNTDGEKYTKISFREAGTEYAALTVSNTSFAFSKLPLHATHYIASTTTLCTNLNADLLDGLHHTAFGHTLNNKTLDANDYNSLDGLWGGKVYNATNLPYTYYAFLHFGYGQYYCQFNAYKNTLQFRAGSENDATPSWRTIACIDSNVASATNADKTDGYHADINNTASTLVTRDTDAHVRLSAIRNSRSKGAALSSAGWYRVFTSTIYDAGGDTIMLNIARSYSNANNEAYQFAITLRTYGSGYKPCITQLSGVYASHLITKIRVVQKYNSVYYIDIYYSGTNANNVYISGFGTGTFCAPVAATIPDGYTATEFDTVQGVKSNNPVISTDSFRLPYSSISEISKYLQLASGGNELIFSSGGADIMYVNYRAATVGTAVTKWIWCGGTSTSRAAMEMGDLTAASLTATSLTAASFVKFQQSGASAFVQLTATADGRVNVSYAGGSMGAINGKDGQWDFTKAYIGTSLTFSDTSKIYGSPAIASGNKYWCDHDRTKGLWWDSSINAFHMNGTLVVDGDVQSLSSGPDYGGNGIVSFDVVNNQVVKIPATAPAVFIKSLLDGGSYTIEFEEAPPAEVGFIPIYVYESSPGDGTIIWNGVNGLHKGQYTYYGMNMFALVRISPVYFLLRKIATGS